MGLPPIDNNQQIQSQNNIKDQNGLKKWNNNITILKPKISMDEHTDWVNQLIYLDES